MKFIPEDESVVLLTSFWDESICNFCNGFDILAQEIGSLKLAIKENK